MRMRVRKGNRMLRNSEHGNNRRIGLWRPKLQVRVLRVPVSESGVMLRDRLKSVIDLPSWRFRTKRRVLGYLKWRWKIPLSEDYGW
jgi:hypothetical protein